MCAISQTNEYSNKLHIWTNKMFDCQHASPPSCPVYVAEQCKTIGKLRSFPSLDLCHMQANDIIVLSVEDTSALLHLLVLWGCLLQLWAPVSRGDLWPLLQGYNSPSGLAGDIYKVSSLQSCDFSSLLMLRHISPNTKKKSKDPSSVCSGCLFLTISSLSDVPFRKSLQRHYQNVNVAQMNAAPQCEFESEWSDCSQ